MKKYASLERERDHRAKLLYEMNQKLLKVRDIHEIAQLAAEYLESHLMGSSVFYAKNSKDGDSLHVIHAAGSTEDIALFHSEPQRARAESILKEWSDPSERLLVCHPVCYVPVCSKGALLGLVGVIGFDKTDPVNLSFLQMLIGQITLAMELQYALDQQQALQIIAEKEKMRSILLSAISHDLRTPLTGIMNAGSVIREQADTLSASKTRLLAKDIQKNAEWLIRMVENLLAVTRISGQVMKVQKTMEIAEEVMAQSVSIVRNRFPECNIRIKAVDEPLLAPMDAILMVQVLINLLENAVKYSPPGALVQLSLHRDHGFAWFEVNDQGKGIPDPILGRLFEPHALARERAGGSVSGIGIGLSICKAIVDAHDGTITGHNKPDGGMIFRVILPLVGG